MFIRAMPLFPVRPVRTVATCLSAQAEGVLGGPDEGGRLGRAFFNAKSGGDR